MDELELSVRTANLLQNMGVVTLRQLVQKSDVDVLKMRDVGRETLKERSWERDKARLLREKG